MGDSGTAPSARVFEQRLTAAAHAAAGKAYEPPPAKPPVPLVPVYIGIDAQNEAFRETFLYRLGDPSWAVRPATSRFLLETGLPGGQTEKTVEDQVKAALRPYQDWPGPGRQALVELKFFVRLGEQVFRDEVLWDVTGPSNSGDAYAQRVCADLRLGCDWYDAIRAHVQGRVEEVKQDLREAPEDVQLQQPVQDVTRRAPPGPDGGAGTSSSRVGVPRVEPYDPSSDAEAARVAARQQLLQQRQQKRQQAAAALTAQQQPPQAQPTQVQQAQPTQVQQAQPMQQGQQMQPQQQGQMQPQQQNMAPGGQYRQQ